MIINFLIIIQGGEMDKVTYFKGFVKEKRNSLLRKKYNFPDWHIAPIEYRPYAQYVSKIVNEYVADSAGVVVEIGCGLGEIISSIRVKRKFGFDIKKEVLQAARLLHPAVKFEKG